MALYNNIIDDQFVAGLNNYIAKELSPKSFEGDSNNFPVTITNFDKPAQNVGRPLRDTEDTRLIPSLKYKRSLPMAGDPRSTMTGSEKAEGSSIGTTIRLSTIEAPMNRSHGSCDEPRTIVTSVAREMHMDSPTIPGRPALPYAHLRTMPSHELDILPDSKDLLISTIDEAIDDCLLTELQVSPSKFFDFSKSADLTYSPNQTSLTVTSPRRLSELNVSSARCSPRTTIPWGNSPTSVMRKSRREQFRNFKFDSYGIARTTVISPAIAPPVIILKPVPKHVKTLPNVSPTACSPVMLGRPLFRKHVDSVSNAACEKSSLGKDDTPTQTTMMDRKVSTMTEKRRIATQKVFDTLPTGCKAARAHESIGSSDIDMLKTQAFNQATNFEVLKPEDVESMSKELQSLDEGCDYLRTTYRKLRSDRRSLQARICILLRDSREAKFSHDALIKQEETLAELDFSIDGWDNKLHIAENRRTRVRQKLLEHIAATLAIPCTIIHDNNIEQPPTPSEKPLPVPTTDSALITPPGSPITGITTTTTNHKNEAITLSSLQSQHYKTIKRHHFVLPDMPGKSMLRTRNSAEETQAQVTSKGAQQKREDHEKSVKRLVKKLEVLGNTASLPEKCQALGM